MISIIIIIIIMIIQADSVVSDTNGFISYAFSPWGHEE